MPLICGSRLSASSSLSEAEAFSGCFILRRILRHLQPDVSAPSGLDLAFFCPYFRPAEGARYLLTIENLASFDRQVRSARRTPRHHCRIRISRRRPRCLAPWPTLGNSNRKRCSRGLRLDIPQKTTQPDDAQGRCQRRRRLGLRLAGKVILCSIRGQAMLS